MKTKHKPALTGNSQKKTTSPSIVEETLTKTNDLGASENHTQPDTDVNPILQTDDAQEFAKLDSVVQRGLRSFIDVGVALGEIRQRALWKAGGYNSWAAYCAKVGGLTRIHANRLIRGAKIARYLSPVKPIGFTLRGVTTPRSEGQVRPLGVLKTNDDRAAAWHKAIDIAGGQPTEKIVQHVVDEMRKPNGNLGQKTNWKEVLLDFIGRLRDALIEEQPRAEIENLIAELETNLKV